jgi:hypothetical protein
VIVIAYKDIMNQSELEMKRGWVCMRHGKEGDFLYSLEDVIRPKRHDSE